MRRLVVMGMLLVAVGFLSERARAQATIGVEATPSPEQEASDAGEATITRPPDSYLAPASGPYETYALWEAETKIRRARNGLIATSAAFGVGWVFLGAASTQCNRDVNNELVCNDAGRALGTIGLISASGGLVGMIVSGILLPVRQKKERDLRRSLHQRQPARLRWDIESGRMVF